MGNILTTLSGVLRRPIKSVELLKGGRNSRVYLTQCTDGDDLVIKMYSPRIHNQRNLLVIEYAALNFLWQNGVRCTPKPIAIYEDAQCSVFSFVGGKPATSIEITSDDISEAIDFLKILKQLTFMPGGLSIGPASEACLSVQDAISHIKYRVSRLLDVPSDSEQCQSMRNFLTKEFTPTLEVITEWARNKCLGNGTTFQTEINPYERILSPSDFGFHNAIRTDSGLVFLDFEHFGWDDPAKTISDFLLHPAMKLSFELRRQFADQAITALSKDLNLLARLPIVYPFFGLKWCLIFLNEFLHDDIQRRQFAASCQLDVASVQKDQLIKSRRMLTRIANEYEHFPYTT